MTIPEDGSVDADIRFVARTDIPDGFALITVTGRASSPQIIFDSVPEAALRTRSSRKFCSASAALRCLLSSRFSSRVRHSS